MFSPFYLSMYALQKNNSQQKFFCSYDIMFRKLSPLCKGSNGLFRRLSGSAGGSQVYEEEFSRSISDPEGYWGQIALENTIWSKPWTRVLDHSSPPFSKWFVDAELSLVYNAVDRHVDEGHGSQKALVWDSPITGSKKSLSYTELKDEVTKMSRVLQDKYGVRKGDRVIIYMPMILETLVAMLAVARLGAIHSVVFGGFSAKELSVRIKHIQAKMVLTASCGLEPNRLIQYKPIVNEALKRAGCPDLPVIVYQRRDHCIADLKPGRDEEWQSLVEEGAPSQEVDCVPVGSNDPLYVLYTSGTTGSPKGVQIPVGPHAVVNKWTMSAVYGMNPGDTWFTYSDMGWAVGHGYVCYSPLLHRNTSIVFEGKPAGTPDAGQFSRVIAENQVRGLFLAPTGLRLLKREDPDFKLGSKHSCESLQAIFVGGERCDEPTKEWASKHFGAPVLDHWWQTETAHPMTGHCIGLGNTLHPPKDSTGRPVPGFDIHVVNNETGEDVPTGEMGRIVCKLPLAPGCLSTLFDNDEGFVSTYFSRYPGFYDTMDAGILEANGYVKVLARDDDVINVAGHRLSTSRLEEVLITHPEVTDCAIVGVADDLKGQIPLGLIVLQKSFKESGLEDLKKELVSLVRSGVGPVAALKVLLSVKALPRTRSGKITRKIIADMAMGKEIKVPATIEDPSVIGDIRSVLMEHLKIQIPEPQG
eukprot:TRINITY_DN3895_c0_g1_i1.p1 TRINITY_DN3895_c0_g1~~TRINITY_DN3895_c0_g1_i1.p1  ORF type:complete len:698 (+),score=137.77 TRINITY_DN3895_c0_g1_i1:70-2163(+)